MQTIAYLQQNLGLFYVYVTIVGALVGSFLNVVIYRLPVMMRRDWHEQCEELVNPTADPDSAPSGTPAPTFNLMVPRSRCPKCEHLITARENIPIISFLLQGGKCAHCKTSISKRYPIVEALTALISLFVASYFGVSWQTLMVLILSWGLIALSLIDFDHQLLPDSITLPMMWLGIIIAIFGLFTDLQSSVIGAIAGYLTLWSVYWAFKLITGKEGMGYGDFKLLAVFGAWLGWQALPIIVLLSSLVGAIIGISLIVFRGRDRNIPIPFGPYIAIAGWIALFWGKDLIELYLRVSGITVPG
ncbi:MAG: A24 family peptidase [Thiohalomonadales bacterium]